MENDNWSAGNKNSVVSCISSLVNLNEYIVMIPLASRGSGGNHMIVIDVTVTSETVIFCGGPEGADA